MNIEKLKQYFGLRDKYIKSLLDPKTQEISCNFSRPVNCILCGENHPKALFKKDGFNFVKCRCCGHIYVNPRLSDEALNNYYTGLAQDYFYANIWELTPTAKENIKKTFGVLEKYKKCGRILDVCCGTGYVLAEAEKKGWQPFGVELNRQACIKAKQLYGLDILPFSLKDARFNNEYFDAVVMVVGLCGVSEPRQTLEEIYRVLKKGGLFICYCENIDSFIVKLTQGKHRFWTGAYTNFFSSGSIVKLAKKSGFDKAVFVRTSKEELGLLNLIRFLRNPWIFDYRQESFPSSDTAIMGAEESFTKGLIKCIISVIDYPLKILTNIFKKGSYMLAVFQK